MSQSCEYERYYESMLETRSKYCTVSPFAVLHQRRVKAPVGPRTGVEGMIV